MGAQLTVKNPDDFAHTRLRISNNSGKINNLGENLAIVKIADMCALMALQEHTKILKNQLVHGSSSLLRDSVKNSDSGSAGWQERAHNTPNMPRPVPGRTWDTCRGGLLAWRVYQVRHWA